jgi:hypothetical protein
MAFRPLAPRERWLALFAAGGLLLLAGWSAAMLWRERPPGPRTVEWGAVLGLSLALAGLLLWRLRQLHSLEYWLDRDALRIRWAGDVVIIPLSHIHTLAPASQGPKAPWWRWPLCWMAFPSGRNGVRAYATAPASACLAVSTAQATYLISPADRMGFLRAYETRRAFGSGRVLAETILPSAWHEHWLHRDRLAQVLIVAGLLAGLFVLGFFVWTYPTLPAELPLHFDATGRPDLLSPRRALFLLPAITLLIWFFNAALGFALYEQEPLAAYLLWGNGVFVQMAGFWVGRSVLALVA